MGVERQLPDSFRTTKDTAVLSTQWLHMAGSGIDERPVCSFRIRRAASIVPTGLISPHAAVVPATMLKVLAG